MNETNHIQGKLSIVATPIGNLEDITLRALRTLKECDVVACEDTRVTSKLLAHYDISKRTIALHGNSLEKDFVRVEKLLEEGKHVALVSDAGTPGVSDPGLELVSRVREHFGQLRQGVALTQHHSSQGDTFPQLRHHLSETPGPDLSEVVIETIPGPSALAAAVSISGLRAATFIFFGFLPLKKGREKLLTEIAASDRASVVYESPHRILKTLQSLRGKIPPNRRVGVFRELTKMHEESIVGSAEDVLRYFMENSDKVRGEFVIIVEAQ